MAALITDGRTTQIRVDLLHTTLPASDRMVLLGSVRTDAPVETPGFLFRTYILKKPNFDDKIYVYEEGAATSKRQRPAQDGRCFAEDAE